MQTCKNPECNKPLPDRHKRGQRVLYCQVDEEGNRSKKCRNRALYLRNGERIRAKQRRYGRTPEARAIRKAYEASKSPERVAREKAEKAAKDKIWREACKAAGIKRVITPEQKEKNNRRMREKRADPITGPIMRIADNKRYNSIHGNLRSKLSGGINKCLNRFGEGKEQRGAFTLDGDDSWLDYTKEEAIATLFLVTHNAAWMIAHDYTHALTIERDGDGIPIDFFNNYDLHHIKEQYTFKGRIEDPSTRREAIRELWALDNLVLIHKDEHKHYHSNDNQPSNQSTKSGEMNNE